MPPSQTPPPPPSPGSPPRTSYEKPADYYQTPPAQPDRKGCWKWGLGCGGAGCLLIILLGIGAVLMAPKIIGFFFGQLEKAVVESAAPDVTDEQREDLRREIAEIRRHLREDRISMEQLQPLLTETQRAIGDQLLTSEEVDELTRMMRELNERAGSGVAEEEF